MTRAQFARYCLMRLGIGDDLQRVTLYPKYPRKLAPPEEVRPGWKKPPNPSFPFCALRHLPKRTKKPFRMGEMCPWGPYSRDKVPFYPSKGHLSTLTDLDLRGKRLSSAVISPKTSLFPSLPLTLSLTLVSAK